VQATSLFVNWKCNHSLTMSYPQNYNRWASKHSTTSGLYWLLFWQCVQNYHVLHL